MAHRPMSTARYGGPSAVWFLTALGIATLAALPSLALIRSRGLPYALGGFFGTVLLIAVVGALFSLKSRRAGLIAIVVVGSLALVGNIGRAVQRNETARQIDAAIDDLGLENDADFVPTESETRCFDATGYSDTDLLTALTDMSEAGEQAQFDLLDAIASCAPRALLTDDAVESYRQSFSAGLRGEIPTEEARCMLEQIIAAPTPSAVLSTAESEALTVVLDACLSEQTWAVIGGAPGTGAQSIGDDPALDQLAELCREGADVTCDLLYGRSSAGSEYEDLSFDCGGRGLQSEEACVPGLVDSDGNGYFDDDSPGWPAVLDACVAGDMPSCDFAFANAEFDSEPERIGLTCGERRAVIVGGTCIERFGLTAD